MSNGTPTTNVPSPTFGNTGYQAPPESAILTGVELDFNAAFGGGLNPGLSTPQGQLSSSLTAIIGNVNDTVLYQSTQTDPAFAQGRWQDAIGRIYFISRNPALPTVVQVVCSGLAGVVVPAGALVVDVNGNQYACNLAGIISQGGTVTLPFSCTVAGPTVCPAGTVTTILSTVPGWSSVTNVQDGVIGQNTESRAAFEARRQESVAANSAGSVSSIVGAVLNVENVIDAYVTENTTTGTVSAGGFTLLPNSLYVAAVGGSPTNIAQAIWSKKAPGCGYNGNTTVTIYDQNSGYNFPPPSYQVTFEIPSDLEVCLNVTLINNATVPSNATSLVQNAIVSAFAGDDGGPRARIGNKLPASRYYSTLVALGSWVQIARITIGSANDADAAVFTGDIGFAGGPGVLTVTGTVAGGKITIGSFILSNGTGAVPPGVMVTALVSGTGALGTYTVNNIVAMVHAESMFSVPADNNTTQVNINQAPVIEPANVNVLLL